VGQQVTRSDIEAGLLCFGPDANESGFEGYGVPGAGNLKADYATFAYQASDGMLLSSQATMTIDISPVADSPLLSLANPPDTYGATVERFHTGWESAPNRNPVFTILPQAQLEGWTVVREALDTGQQAFILWSSGDKMKDAANTNRTVYADAGNGQNFLEIGNAMGLGHQTFGIERSVSTRAGATYRLSFDYAGRLGYSTDFTRIGFYVDGVLAGTYANTSPNTALNWQAVGFEFTGNGTAQTLRIVTEAVAAQSNGRGAMIDDITLTEQLPLNTGIEASPIRLSAIVASLADTDGSESLTLTVGAIPVGATLTDGTNSFTASLGSTTAQISAWDWDNLSITPPAGYTGIFDLTVAASASEAVTGESASYALALTVTVLPANTPSPIVLDLNGDGVKTVSLSASSGKFDLLNSGSAVRSGWISAEDGFLAIDANGNGAIDDRSELFGGAVGEGFAKLARLDSNLDGAVDAKDERFAELKIWQDRNGNHATDAGELGSLADYGIVSLSTRYVMAPEIQSGNWLLERGTATTKDGRSIAMADAYFEVARPEEPSQSVATLARREEEDRGATIVVRSESAHPMPLGPDPILLGAGANRLIGTSNQGAPVIDWTGASSSALGAAGDDFASEKKKSRWGGWLAEFLGTKSAANKTLAEQTGLKVVLDAERRDGSNVSRTR